MFAALSTSLYCEDGMGNLCARASRTSVCLRAESLLALFSPRYLCSPVPPVCVPASPASISSFPFSLFTCAHPTSLPLQCTSAVSASDGCAIAVRERAIESDRRARFCFKRGIREKECLETSYAHTLFFSAVSFLFLSFSPFSASSMFSKKTATGWKGRGRGAENSRTRMRGRNCTCT